MSNRKHLMNNLHLSSYDDIFGDDDPNLTVQEISLSKLHPFSNHPFLVLDDESMKDLTDSIRRQGVLVPIIVRKDASGEGYELVSGHRRSHAAELAGLATVPAFVKDLSDDDATLLMVDSNLQRENVSVHEKAFALRMKYDVLKHQGVHTERGSALSEISESTGEHEKTIQRLIRLTYLSDGLWRLVDEGKLGTSAGYDLSFLPAGEQEIVAKVFTTADVRPDGALAVDIRAASETGEFSESWLWDQLGIFRNKPKPRKVTFNKHKLDTYFDKRYSNEEIEDIIFSLLDDWKKKEGAYDETADS